MTTYEKLSLGLEGLVVVILLVEFWYDLYWNNHEARLKRRQSKQKKTVASFEQLTTGEHK